MLLRGPESPGSLLWSYKRSLPPNKHLYLDFFKKELRKCVQAKQMSSLPPFFFLNVTVARN